MNRCGELMQFLADYLEGDLPEAQRRVLAAHLAECAPCRAYLETYSDVIRRSRASWDEACEQAPEDLIQAVLAARAATGRDG